MVGLLEVGPVQPDHIRGEHPVRLGGDIDVPYPETPGLPVDQVAERYGHAPLALDGHHRLGAPVDQESRRPVAEATAVVDVEAARRRASELVTEVGGHDAASNSPRLQARRDPG